MNLLTKFFSRLRPYRGLIDFSLLNILAVYLLKTFNLNYEILNLDIFQIIFPLLNLYLAYFTEKILNVIKNKKM